MELWRGILRLARNSVDGGRIIYLIDIAKVVALKFPTFWLCKSVDKFLIGI